MTCSITPIQVALGEADMAIGGDQGGSIRIPASRCGIVGLKPTHGLVPYSGACAIEPTIDHLGPMAKTVEDVALLLEVNRKYDLHMHVLFIHLKEIVELFCFGKVPNIFTPARSCLQNSTL